MLYPTPASLSNSQADAQLQSAQLQAIATTRAAFIAGLAGFAAIGSLWANARNVRINQLTLEVSRESQEEGRRAQTEALNLQTAALTLQGEGLLTDRYSKAIEQLGQPGKEKLAVRLGGIHALHRIATASPVDQPSIVAVLSAFIQQQGSVPADDDPARLDAHRPAVDAQAAANVIGRLPRLADQETIDWTGVHLERGSLPNVNLSGAYLGFTHLQRIYLSDSICRGANFNRADLRGAILTGVDLTDAKLTSAKLEGARLERANLAGADFRGAALESASLSAANLRQTDFRGTDLSKVRGLNRKQLEAARTDARTLLPPRLLAAEQRR
jgi:uncharacterized protein YjbI with pentapeptide repeats